jgi:decaprenylphospho-beta-D-erythro-pentofuranosid-2-ulose 2-reductase
MKNQTVLILGASSDVGRALAEIFYANNHSLLLAARNINEVDAYLKSWPSQEHAHTVAFEATDFQQHETWFQRLPSFPDITICVFGYLGDQKKAERDWSESQKIINTNYLGAVSILNVIANAYQKAGVGVIAGISSVAGDRGRQSNFIYGSAKAGFTAYLSGLRNRLAHVGVHVLTIKPGFIDTKMTAGLKLPKPITAQPSQVAKSIYKAIMGKRNVVYVLWMWFWIMLIIKLIPEFVFKKLKM